ncbi:serine hydrolase [Prosthecobacter sp. SYSU 5D2]|uniref:serine hydrolase domain-containing protein n=1 Tax=Prosthecobacter sp. SYSU 5D2 TaxID=3134134 RepID=UPI0031FE5ED2
MPISSLRACFFLLVLHSALQAQVPGGSWEKLADPAKKGWSVGKLQAARQYTSTLDTEAVMIVVDGKVLDEWGAVEQRFNVHSIRKSFLSALYGIQVEGGSIKMEETMADLDVGDNEPGLTDIEKKATVADLLKARSGIYHPALYETAKMKAARPQRHSHKPGEFWYYNNWDFNALGTVYEQKTGAGIYEDFKKQIADPIGMQDYRVEDGEYVTGADSIHRAYPFRMTARDMARFGLLFLRGGQWDGKQVIPAAWVEESTTSYSNAGNSGGYGYLWWIATGGKHFQGVSLPDGSYSARGAGGHYILVVPPLDLVIVHRVNTNKSGRRVESTQFGELVRLILQAHETAGETSSSSSVLDREVPVLMTKHHVPGVAVIGIENHRITWEKYFGVREAGKEAPVDERTVFEAASMTKPLAVYAALKLVEQGKLDMDRPLNEYLPAPYLPDEPLHLKITARMVMSHTGGFPNWRGDKPLKVMHEPGTNHLYSGEGILLLQRVMEQITGEDLQPYLQRTLMEPLGMKSSSLIWQEAYTVHAAAGHDDEGRAKTGRKLYTRPNAAYSLYCTPRDYAAFVLEMMNPDRSAPHSLTAESIKSMLTRTGPVTDKEGLTRRDGRTGEEVRYGLGWSIESTASGDRIRHGGSNGTGFRSYTEFDPKCGHGMVIMTNSTQGDELWQEVVRLIGTP